MAKKRKCRRSQLEKAQHDTAVKVRKMTDEQLCDFLNEVESRNISENKVGEFLVRLKERTGLGGISTRTITKLHNIAAEMGYITEV